MVTNDLLTKLHKEAENSIEKSTSKMQSKGSMRLSNFLSKKFSEEQYLVEGLIPLEGVGMIVGKPTSMKTFISLYLAKCVAGGIDFLNVFKTQQGAVLIVNLDDHPRTIYKRFKLIHNDEESDFPIFILTREDIPDFDINSDQTLNFIIQEIQKNNIKLVIFDTFVKTHHKKEDSSGDMSEVFTRFKRLPSLGSTVAIIHHTRKGSLGKTEPSSEEIRGSSAIFGELDWEISFDKTIKDGKTTINAFSLKNKEGEEAMPFSIEIEKGEGKISFTYNGEYQKPDKIEERHEELERQIIDLLKVQTDWIDREEIRKHIQQGRDAIINALNRLDKENVILSKKLPPSQKLVYRYLSNDASEFPNTYKELGSQEASVIKIPGEHDIDELLDENSSLHKMIFSDDQA